MYVTLEPFRVSGSMGDDRENRVLGVGRGSGSRGRYNRRGAQARDDEQRCEERGEQQAPAPQGPTVLPPPPPVDYGVFMQGLVQAMQTQAQTQAALLRLQLQFLKSMAMVVRLSWRGLRRWLCLLLRGRVSHSWQRAG
ncbi:hypothetical protein Taro_026634 [Colocasia esculenta]|uniref:Uncharacterized protein n=1 Tax=Colocasia esculenta TaxID=4460 RepID=A0A843VFR8_COLES|nr:hypothetical protein [Colocasia esculenta]